MISGLGRSIIVFSLGAFVAMAVLWFLIPAENEPLLWSEKTTEEIGNTIRSASQSEVIDFMNWAESQHWDPAHDVIPAYVANAGDIRKARAAVESHYAQFAGKEDTALVRAVKNFPEKYMDYCDEMRAVDRFFIRR